MTKIISSTDNLARQKVKEFLIPSWATILFYIFLGFLTLALLKISVIIDVMLNNSQLTRQDIVVGDNITKTLGKLDSGLGNLSSFLIWMLIGTVIYGGLWVFRNTYHSVATDLTDSHAPTVMNKKQPYWKSNGAKYIAVPSVTIGVLSYIYFMLHTVRVTVLGSATGVYHLVNGNVYLWALLSVLIIALLLYVLNMLMHILAYVYRSLIVGD